MVDPLLAHRLIGVVDLADGRAVHAIAGNRQCYRDVAFCAGDPLVLAKHYLALGLRRLYVADLDSIGGDPLQTTALDALLHLDFEQTMLDVGWQGGEVGTKRAQVAELASSHSTAQWIAATESCDSVDAFLELIECVTARNTFLGLDYRQHQLVSCGPSEYDWILAAIQSRCLGVVVLDVAAVGTGAGPMTTDACRRIREVTPALQVVSGGGVRDMSDVRTLIDAGSDAVMVATVLFPDTGTAVNDSVVA